MWRDAGCSSDREAGSAGGGARQPRGMYLCFLRDPLLIFLWRESNRSRNWNWLWPHLHFPCEVGEKDRVLRHQGGWRYVPEYGIQHFQTYRQASSGHCSRVLIKPDTIEPT